MATITKSRRNNSGTTKPKNGSRQRYVVDFALDSLESELSAIGKTVPAKEWAGVPSDYFANLDHYLHDAPKKK